MKKPQNPSSKAVNWTELEKPTRFGHFILFACTCFIIAAITWAYFARLDEVTVAQGEVIPSQHVQIVQNLEGGIVKEILVKEGQIVKKNQTLITLSDVRFSSDYKTSELKQLGLEAKIKRLSAEAKNRPLVFPLAFRKRIPKVIKSEQALFDAHQSTKKSLQHRRDLVAKEVNMTKPLVKEGAASHIEVLRLEQKLSELDSQITTLNGDVLNTLTEARKELSSIQVGHATLKDRLERTEVRSPVDGIVKQIHMTTIGGVIQPGMNLVEIVPLDDTLLVEAKLRPSDIAFIHPGQEAMVKLTAYDFSIYGGLKGTVEHIGADTTKSDTGESFYEISVRTKENHLGLDAKDLQIIPGMQASVDILTGNKTVLQYLMKPILKAKQRALRER